MRRLPAVATAAVLLAVAAMLALGFWQLHRRDQKEAMIARFTANAGKDVLPLPRAPTDDLLFRRVTARCLAVTGWSVSAGRTEDGTPGWRHIAHCKTGPRTAAFRADMGVGNDPKLRPNWEGGRVTGLLTQAPTGTPAIAAAFGARAAKVWMIVAEAPAPGLAPSHQPDPADVPNNHFAYAVQWFAFAAIAAAIYALALRWRLKG
ncbi:SURF1 family protein [Sphingomonas sp. ACRSK]|uniref:SURF1 family protein n=1 Tax=Sphingomonas sp. ACRSK TaxID=2918213 RepID=UPI001EF6778D|nr:SURF1 family protein [Sphingomonas sp. ACRSK]MCG7347285.1 SURF1 family protein [Sphingomonas sp. ACRSK]